MDHREIEDIAAAELLAGRADAYVSQTVAQMYENAIAVINVVEPLIRADEKAKVLAVEAMLVPATVEAELSFYRDDLRAKVEALLEQAKRERDAQPKVDQRDSPYLYGNNMHAGGRVVGIAEVLFTLFDGSSDGPR